MTVGMSLCLARRRPPTRRAISTAEIVGRVNDFGSWYQTFGDSASGHHAPASHQPLAEHVFQVREALRSEEHMRIRVGGPGFQIDVADTLRGRLLLDMTKQRRRHAMATCLGHDREVVDINAIPAIVEWAGRTHL